MDERNIIIGLVHECDNRYVIVVDIEEVGVAKLSYDFDSPEAAEKYAHVVAEYIELFGFENFLLRVNSQHFEEPDDV